MANYISELPGGMRKLLVVLLVAALALFGRASATQAHPQAPIGENKGMQNEGVFVDSGQRLGNQSTRAIALGDLDGDGTIDAFFANGHSSAPNEVWLNDGAGLFSNTGQLLGSANSTGVALADLNGNGFLDAVVSNGDLLNQVWLNDGTGHFSAGQAFNQVVSTAVALGDLNGDGHVDVVFANSFANTIWFNNGDGTFEFSDQLLGTVNSHDVALGDLNGDGHLDIVFANNGANTVWFNNGLGVFLGPPQMLGDAWSDGVALGDVNGNGHLDIVFANFAPVGSNRVWFNDGSGVFSAADQTFGTTRAVRVYLADLFNRGVLDAVLVNYIYQGIFIWRNDGAGNFLQSTQTLLHDDLLEDAALAELNGDGYPDIFVAHDRANQVWFSLPGDSAERETIDLRVGIGGYSPPDTTVYRSEFWLSSPETVEVNVQNFGPEAATDVWVELSMSDHPFYVEEFQFVWHPGNDADCTIHTCRIDTLATGERRTLRGEYHLTFVPSDRWLNSFEIVAQVRALEPDRDHTNNRHRYRVNYFDCELTCTIQATMLCHSYYFGPAGIAGDFSVDAFAGQAMHTTMRTTMHTFEESPLDEPPSDAVPDAIVDLSLYYRVRGQILGPTPAGQHYIDLFYTHDAAIKTLLVEDEALWDKMAATLAVWEPALRALMDEHNDEHNDEQGNGQDDGAAITPAQIAALESLLEGLAAGAGPELQQAIAAEQERLGALDAFVGMTMNEARARLVGYGTYLPAVERQAP